ncbi:MAG: hypothetical protein L0Y73_01290 [Candidatus Aminicenantes bacterium]|nr:hypothetical protein [Candidatus Aminicenantes bacterium]
MWECRMCRRSLDDEDETCWSCGGLRTAVELIKEQKPQDEDSDEIIPQPGKTWECKICRRMLDDSDEECWSCGSKRTDAAAK